MKVVGSHVIAAPRERIWQLLNNPEVLARCTPGVTRMVPDGEDRYLATLKLGVGPVRGTFEGYLEVSDKYEPETMILEVAGNGGPGGVRARGEITLAPDGNGTVVHYQGEPQLSGRLATVGARLLTGIAKKMAGQFFSQLEEEALAA